MSRPLSEQARRQAASWLESGRLARLPLAGTVARGLGSAYGALSRPARPLRLPPGVRGIGVGGATLGGNYVTPTCLELMKRLSAVGHTPAYIGHGYRRSAARAGSRVEAQADVNSLGEMGDEGLLLSRLTTSVEEESSQQPGFAKVFVGASRHDALSLCAAQGRTLAVLDGVLQTDQGLSASLLVVDGQAPFGAGRCPPAGDLRAPPQKLLSTCDAVVVWRHVKSPQARVWTGAEHHVTFEYSGAKPLAPDSPELDWKTLKTLRVGLLTAVGRPGRVLAALQQQGLTPTRVEAWSDHTPLAWAPPAEGVVDSHQVSSENCSPVDVWLTTSKNAVAWPRSSPARWRNAPVAQISWEVRWPEALTEWLGNRLMSAQPP